MIDTITLKKINQAKAEGQKIGLVQGSWDLFHLGHLIYLQEAKKLCDFLVVAMDDDEKIRYRKGNNRPIIPLEERYQMIEKLNIASAIVVKNLDDPKWDLIKKITPDFLIGINENYKEEDIKKLEAYCQKVVILPRQATTSTSDIIRRTLIKNGLKLPSTPDNRLKEAIEKFKTRINFQENLPTPIPQLIDNLKKSTDYVTPVSACCFFKGRWYFGVNQIDTSIPQSDITNRTEFLYSTIEHAEINLLKNLGEVNDLSHTPIWTTLFPCDKCLKVLIDKKVKEIYYLEDHPDKNWSKRSHKLAAEKNIKIIKLTTTEEKLPLENIESHTYKYIDPRNARHQDQLEIMLEKESQNQDPLDPHIINQEILFSKKYWYVTQNKFPYEEIDYQFLIISLNPIYNKNNMPKEMWEELREIWNTLTEQYNLQGGAICYRFGDTLLSGASLKRLHAHIIVPKENHKTKFTIGGNKEVKKELRRNLKK